MRFDAAAALFDMDGTLVDSTAVVERVWSEFAERHGADRAELLTYSHGRQAIDSVRRFASADADHRELVRTLQAEELDRAGGTVEIPGAHVLLTALEGAPTAVVTSAPGSLARGRLRAAGLPIPAVVVTADEIEHGKPDPSGYLAAAAALGVPADRCVVFEDAEAGIRAALAAGARCVVVGPRIPSGLPPLPRVEDLRAVAATWSPSDRVIRFDLVSAEPPRAGQDG